MRTVLAASAAAIGCAGASLAAEAGFYGAETFSVDYELTGAESGAITEHVRSWGALRAELISTQISFSGFEEATEQRVVYDGARVVTIDLATGATTIAGSAGPSGAEQGSAGGASGAEALAAMGGAATGRTEAYAGFDCEVWDLPALSSEVCVTEEGITLHAFTQIGGLTSERTAVEVRMGDGGPDAAFDYDAAAASQPPDF
ncbi:MAG: hypothetical protein PVI23_03425 [Maricaulaceae bacterium]|jgi:hypothetical protein